MRNSFFLLGIHWWNLWLFLLNHCFWLHAIDALHNFAALFVHVEDCMTLAYRFIRRCLIYWNFSKNCIAVTFKRMPSRSNNIEVIFFEYILLLDLPWVLNGMNLPELLLLIFSLEFFQLTLILLNESLQVIWKNLVASFLKVLVSNDEVLILPCLDNFS